jgi:hypothetical protein
VTLAVGQAIGRRARRAVRLDARLAVTELGHVQLRCLPVQGPGLELAVAEHQQDDDDHPARSAGPGNRVAQAERVEEGVADRVGAPRKRILQIGRARPAQRQTVGGDGQGEAERDDAGERAHRSHAEVVADEPEQHGDDDEYRPVDRRGHPSPSQVFSKTYRHRLVETSSLPKAGSPQSIG